MKLSNPVLRSTLHAAAVLCLALSLGACSRSQQVTSPAASAGRNGAGQQVLAGCPTLVANTPATADDFIVETGAIPNYVPGGRLRIETSGDIAGGAVRAAGACAASDVPTINFVGGHANVFVNGTTNSITTTGDRLTFDALLFPGALVEPGVVLATDAQGNVLEIIWPELSGLGPGSPIVRVELAQWNEALIGPLDKLDVAYDLIIEQDGVQQHIKGSCGAIPLDGTMIMPNAPTLPPCPTTLGPGGLVTNYSADVVQFKRRRLRFEVTGDMNGVIDAAGFCAASETPSVQFTGGMANMFQAGTDISVTETGQPILFDALLFPGMLLEPGIVIAKDANRNVLEIIWPGLAGLPPGAPILRLQVERYNAWVRTGRAVDFRMRFDAVGPDGQPASFDVVANNIIMPQQR